ncbi:pectinesterase QRT1-like [Impatiens glandulifera]|uniref:pectinesterase QRT1-like n=1 Tax=Impatiens glandulifera TaxID=253017 RepID=UPI001FB18961|nr:pectinesterase QRT1-like [Impatiens glandulifera]
MGCAGNGQQLQMGFISWDDMKVFDTSNERSELKENRSYRSSSISRVIVVDKTGRGDSLTVQGAIDMVPHNNSQRIKIHILPGIYREKVYIPASKPLISLIGYENRSSETIITWNNKASDKDMNGVVLGTYKSATVTIESDYFCATAITFENSVVAIPGGDGMQAVALRIDGNMAMFYRVRVLGTQDTLLDYTGSHYFYQSYIQGAVDFIFGRARSLYQDCILRSTAKRFGAIAAHHRDSPAEDTGFSFVNCKIYGTGTILLGRAWGNYSRTIFSYCEIDNNISPSGWSDWNDPSRQKTVVFGEYKCKGKGADRKKRVSWSRSFSDKEATPFLDTKFIGGDKWLRL